MSARRRHGAGCSCAVCEEVREYDRRRGPETAVRIGPGDALYDTLRNLETTPQPGGPVYRVHLTPDAVLVVEESGNVVLVTPERRITITHIERWLNELETARTIAGSVT